MYLPSPTDYSEEIAPNQESGGDPAHVHQLLRTYVRHLAGTTSQEGIAATLGAFGVHFRMPHLEMARSHPASATGRWIEVYRSADVPQNVSAAFRSHPLRNWARHAGSTVSLSDMDGKLAMRGLKRAPELTAMQGLLVNVQAGPDHTIHCLFYGEHGADNGLARSLLHLAALLAHERVATSAWPVAAPVALGALTSREREVLDLAMTGITDAEIARTLDVAKRTIRFHLTNARQKTGVSTRAELIASAAQRPERRRQ